MNNTPAKQIPMELLEASMRTHHHLCPRQVLGLRIGLLAGKLLELELPRADKRLIAIVETDGCAVDGIAAASGCLVGRRTMYIKDWGKVAATFIDSKTGQAVRIVPTSESRQAARLLLPDAKSRWHAQLEGYQILPDETILKAEPVTLSFSLEQLISQAGRAAICAHCGEEILNQREVLLDGQTLCRACAGEIYYTPLVRESGTSQVSANLPLTVLHQIATQ